MPSDRQFDGIASFDGGLVINKPAASIDRNQASVLRNADFGNNEGIKIRSGYVAYGNQLVNAPAFDGALPFIFQTTTGARYLVAFTNGHVYVSDVRDPSQTWTSVASGFTLGRKWGGAVFGGKLYYGNGIDPIHVLDGATLTDSILVATSGTVPKGNVFTVFKETLVVTGADVDGHFCNFSKEADPTAWDISADAAVKQIIGANDGYVNVGLSVKSGVLKIIRNNGDVYSFDFLDNGLASLQEDGVVLPAVARYGVIDTQNDLYTIGATGVYSFGHQASYFGGDRPGQISAAISPLFDPSHPNGEYDYHLQNIENAAGCFFRGNLIYSVQTSGANQNNWAVVVRPQIGARPAIGNVFPAQISIPWTEWTGWSAAAFCVDTVEDKLYIFSSQADDGTGNNVWVSRDDAFSDAGNAIDFQYRSGKLTMFDPVNSNGPMDAPVRSTMRWIYANFGGSQGMSGTLTVTPDDATTGTAFTIQTPAGTDGTAEGAMAVETMATSHVGSSSAGTIPIFTTFQERFDMLLKGHYFRVTVRVNQVQKRFELYSLAFVKRMRAIQDFKYDYSTS